MRARKAGAGSRTTRFYFEEQNIIDSLTAATLLHVPFRERTGNRLQVYSGHKGIGTKQVYIDYPVDGGTYKTMNWDVAEAMRNPDATSDTGYDATIDGKNFYQGIRNIPHITSGNVVWYFCSQFVPYNASYGAPKGGFTPGAPWGVNLDIQTNSDSTVQITVSDQGTLYDYAQRIIAAADPNCFPTLGLVAGSVSFTIGQPGVFLRLHNGAKYEILASGGGSYTFERLEFYNPNLFSDPAGMKYSFRRNYSHGHGLMVFSDHAPAEQEYYDQLVWMKLHYPRGNKIVWPGWENYT